MTTYVNLVNAGTIKAGEEFNVVVPTGNFGNILAGFIAKKLGVPIKKFISASNKNKVLADFSKLEHTTKIEIFMRQILHQWTFFFHQILKDIYIMR